MSVGGFLWSADYYSAYLNFRPPSVVSVITCTVSFNQSIFNETAWSVRHQSLQNWEWVISDDSKDGSVKSELMQYFSNYWPSEYRIKIVQSNGLGAPGARNTACKQASSEYYYFLDDDDLIEPTTLETLYFSLEMNSVAAFANSWSKGFGALSYSWRRGFGQPADFLSENLVMISVMVRARIFWEIGGFDVGFTKGLEDWDLWLRFMEHQYWGFTVQRFFAWYRRRAYHGDRWSMWNNSITFKQNFSQRFPRISSGQLPIPHCPTFTKYQDTFTHPVKLSALPKRGPRILMIVPWLVMGGADKFNLDLVEFLSSAGWDVTITTTVPNAHVWHDEFSRFTPDIFHLPQFLPFAGYPAFLKHIVATRAPDVVFVSNSGIGFALLNLLHLKPPIVVITYAHMEEENWINGGWARFAARSSSIVDKVFVASKHLKNWMIKRGVAAEKIVVMYVGINMDKFIVDKASVSSFREGLRQSKINTRDDRKKAVLFAARIVDQKRPDIFLKVADKLINTMKVRNFEFWIAGDGELRETLLQYVVDKRLSEYVTFLGAQSIASMKIVLAAADILLLPSKMEGIPCVIFEAMHSGVAVITSDVGGISEVITDKVDGYMVTLNRSNESQDIQAYATILRKLSRNDKIRHSIAAAARARVKDFAFRNMGKILLNSVKQVQEVGRRNRCRELHTRCNIGENLFTTEQEIFALNLLSELQKTEPEYCL